MKHVLILLLLSIAVGVSAQRRSRNLNEPPEVIEGPRTGHGIGVVVSATMGNGLAYRYWPKRIGYHMSFLPAVSSGESFLSWGNALYYTITEFRSDNKLFLHAGLDYNYRKQQMYSAYGSRYNDMSDSFNFGVGPGIETHSRYGSLSCFLGYGLYNRVSRNAGGNSYFVFLSGGVSYFFEI